MRVIRVEAFVAFGPAAPVSEPQRMAPTVRRNKFISNEDYAIE